MPYISAKVIFDEAKGGDALAIQVTEYVCRYLGKGLACAAGMVDPEVFVIGGGVSAAGEYFINLIDKYYKECVFHASRQTKIVKAALGNDAGMYGAASLFLEISIKDSEIIWIIKCYQSININAWCRECKNRELMKTHTTFRIGGAADYYVTPQAEKQIADVIAFLKKSDIKYIVIGNGSNILVSDEGFRGVVLSLAMVFQIMSFCRIHRIIQMKCLSKQVQV